MTVSSLRVLPMLPLMKEQNKKSARVNSKQVEEKVQNDNVELESSTDVDIDERKEPEVTQSKFKTDNLVFFIFYLLII